jgi:outer membrane protein assembly factor BamB
MQAPLLKRALVPWLYVFLTMALVLVLAGCRPGNLIGWSSGWSATTVGSSGDDVTVYVGTRQGEVIALDANKNGRLTPNEQLLWRFSPPEDQELGGVFGGMAVGERYVYVVDKGNSDGEEGRLYALLRDRDRGHSANLRLDLGEWVKQIEGGIVGAPALSGSEDLVFVGSDDGTMYAFATTGGDLRPRWRFETDGQVWSTPVVRGGVLYFGSMDRNVYALSAETGNVLWQYETGGAVVATPLLVDDLVIVGSFDKSLYALNAASGEVAWSFEADDWLWAGAVFDGERIIASSMEGTVYALDRDGNSVWATPFRTDSPIVATPVVVKEALERNVLVVAADSGKLHLLGTRTGEGLAVLMDLGSRVKAPLSVDGAAVFVGSDDSTVRGINVTRWGAPAWEYSTKK